MSKRTKGGGGDITEEIKWRGPEERRGRLMPVDSVLLDPTNPRRHPERSIEGVAASLAEYGQQKPIVVSEAGVCLAGNGTLMAARKLGWTHIWTERSNLEGVLSIGYRIADNRTAELSEWDQEALRALVGGLQADGASLEALGFTQEELQELMAGAQPLAADAEPDVAPQSLPNPVSRRGDLWVLGEHRIICGDSTNPEDVARVLAGEQAALLSTDPPYCVDYTGNDRPKHDGKSSGKDWSQVYREVDIKDLGEFLDAVFRACLPHIVDSAPIYVWHAHVQQPVIAATFERHDLLLHQVVVWVKPTATFGHGYYRWRHEPCAFGWKRGNRPSHGMGLLESVWELDWEGKAKIVGNEHPTQKPLRIFEIPMEQHTKPGACVLEPFSGSGSQLIAGHRLGRRVRAIEISPTFVDVAVRRWQIASGKQATLEETGQTWDWVREERGVPLPDPS